MFQQSRNRAKRYNIDFDISIEDIVLPEYCPLLNIRLEPGTKLNYKNTWSLDRIDNTKGYTKDNVWVISMKANIMKNNASLEELILFSKNVLSNDIVRTHM